MNWLNILSFILEVTGLLLAFIEIKKPLLANQMEDFVDSLEYKFKHFGSKGAETYTFQTLLSISIVIILIFGSWWTLGHFSAMIDEPNFPVWLWVLFILILLKTSIVIFVILLSDFINFLNKFSINEHDDEGRAIGTLGFIIGMIGIVIEISQWEIWK